MIEKRNVPVFLHFCIVYWKQWNCFSKCAICYFHYLKSFWMIIRLKNISTHWFVLIWNICYNKKSLLLQLVALNIYRKHSLRGVPWNRLKSVSIDTSWVHWENQCISTIRKHALLWKKHGYQRSTDIFVRNIFNAFRATGLFLYSLKYIRKPEVSWYFQGALKETRAMKWSKSHLIFSYLFCYSFK